MARRGGGVENPSDLERRIRALEEQNSPYKRAVKIGSVDSVRRTQLGTQYVVQWDPVDQADYYEVRLSTEESLATYTQLQVNGTSLLLSDQNLFVKVKAMRRP